MLTRNFIEPTPIPDTFAAGLLALPDDASTHVYRIFAWTTMPYEFGGNCDAENILVARIVVERAALMQFAETTLRNLLSG